MTLYLDTSALVKLYVTEEGREAVIRAVEEASRVATSTVAYAEARAALARRNREGAISNEEHRQIVSALDEGWESYDRLAVSNAVARRAGSIAERYALRGFDAIHLPSAVRLRQGFENLRFLAFDSQLVTAARQMVPVYKER
ncbi:MAG TPA: type II toxin-antitoxin system VapC family toxin [Rubrobacteraceae bacterium]|nr:type II toxin-antitoxin system VapC family toxin [Rubrobacteraceae bacterium]